MQTDAVVWVGFKQMENRPSPVYDIGQKEMHREQSSGQSQGGALACPLSLSHLLLGGKQTRKRIPMMLETSWDC